MNKTTRWDLPGNLIAESVKAMRPHGDEGKEGLALWFGQEQEGLVRVTHLVVPHGPGLVTHPLYLSLSMRAMSSITRLADRLNTYWVGQIHSHPGQFLNLSDLDKEMGVQMQDYLSVVCPYYAQRATSSLQECGVHVFDKGLYRRLDSKEVHTSVFLANRAVEVIPLEVFA